MSLFVSLNSSLYSEHCQKPEVAFTHLNGFSEPSRSRGALSLGFLDRSLCLITWSSQWQTYPFNQPQTYPFNQPQTYPFNRMQVCELGSDKLRFPTSPLGLSPQQSYPVHRRDRTAAGTTECASMPSRSATALMTAGTTRMKTTAVSRHNRGRVQSTLACLCKSLLMLSFYWFKFYCGVGGV